MDNMNSNTGGFNTQPNSFNYQNTQNTNKSSKSGCLIALAAAGGTVIAIGIVILVAIIAIILAIGNAVGSVSSSISSSDASAAAAYDTDYVETLYFEGTIADNGMYSTGYNHQWTLEEIDRLIDDDYNKGLILYLNSPGGGTYESDEMYQKIMKYKELTGRPVYAYMGNQATSGALYIAMAADEIYAGRMTLTGSIGVIMQNYDLSGLMDKLGIKESNIKSGANKDMFGYSGYTDEQKQILQSIIDENYEIFVNIVAQSRNLPVDTVKTLADGRVFSAQQAKDAGLIDDIATYDQFMENMKSLDDFYTCNFIDAKNNSGSLFGYLFSQAQMSTDNGIYNKLAELFENKNKSPFYYIYQN